ncbi:MAG: hypothetical protein HFI63_10820 [Lachnospiraceae bacterium]|nr:hypothetical protein [Lachnospiraceae bacterium]
MKRKWMVFGAVALFFSAVGLGLYLGTPSIPKRNSEQLISVQSVASLTGYAEEEALRSRFLGILSRKEAVTVRLDEGRETGGFLVEVGDPVKEGSILATYDNASLLLEKEQLLLDREQILFDLENSKLQIRTLKQERNQAEASQKEDYGLQILNAQADLEQKEYELGRKDREVAILEEKLAVRDVVSPCEGVVTEIDSNNGSLSIVSEGSYKFQFSVSEEELKDFQAGDTVTLTSRDGKNSCKGTVSRTDSETPAKSETSSGAARASMYPVCGTVMDAEGFLPGQHIYIGKAEPGEEKADLEQEKKSVADAKILLPEGYVEDASGEPWVWVVGESGQIEKRPVILGVYNDRQNAWQVTEGLSMTDYLAWPSALLEEGQKADFGE